MLIRRNTLKVAAFLVLVLCVVVSTGINARCRDKVETISVSAVGTGTQAGGLPRITLVVYEFSTEADREILIKAFEKSGTEGLSNALHKMHAVGRLELTKSISYDVRSSPFHSPKRVAMLLATRYRPQLVRSQTRRGYF